MNESSTTKNTLFDKHYFTLLIVAMIASFIILVMRRPDIITNAQPWAEDGRVWLAGIYNEGFWSSLLLPQNGYYQTISRVTYGIALIFGIKNAALVANILALLIRCFFVGFILSKRMNFIDLRFRVAVAIYFLLMPNVAEGFVNITNAHWYLSMYLFAVVIAEDAKTRAWKIHDTALIFISGLSGPFVIFIAPCLLLKRISQRGGMISAVRGINYFDVCMAVCCLIQVVAILGSPEGARSPAPLGASLSVLADLVATRIIFGTIFPFEIAKHLASYSAFNMTLFILLCGSLLFAFIKFGWKTKSLILFPLLMIGFALARPVIAIDQPQWPLAITSESGERYFYVTNIALACLFIGLLSFSAKHNKMLLLFFTTAFIFISLLSFRIPEFPDVGYKSDINKFRKLEKGQVMEINILPPSWTMKLKKK